jgi:ribonuclease HI
MVYVMEFNVGGGCRRNGKPDPIGAAACCLQRRWDGYKYQTRSLLRSNPTPTNQRAELTAIIMALEWALKKYDELQTSPELDVRINSDSKYAVGCVETWIYKWARNGWQNSRGCEIANRDLVEKASDLDDLVKELGSVTYTWVPRSDNKDANGHCNEELDEQ